MKAEEAKELSEKANQLRETLKVELEDLYDEIERTASDGLFTYLHHRGYLTVSPLLPKKHQHSWNHRSISEYYILCFPRYGLFPLSMP